MKKTEDRAMLTYFETGPRGETRPVIGYSGDPLAPHPTPAARAMLPVRSVKKRAAIAVVTAGLLVGVGAASAVAIDGLIVGHVLGGPVAEVIGSDQLP